MAPGSPIMSLAPVRFPELDRRPYPNQGTGSVCLATNSEPVIR